MFGRTVVPHIWGPRCTDKFVNGLLENGAYATDIEIRVEELGEAAEKSLEKIRPIISIIEQPGLIFEDEHIRVFADYSVHVVSKITDCFGFRIETKREGKVIVYSGDTAPTETIINLARDCDLLIHDCTYTSKKTVFKERFPDYHTNSIELGEIATKANGKSVVATHFSFQTNHTMSKAFASQLFPEELIGLHIIDELISEIQQNYNGPVRVAEDLMSIEL